MSNRVHHITKSHALYSGKVIVTLLAEQQIFDISLEINSETSHQEESIEIHRNIKQRNQFWMSSCFEASSIL